MLGNKEVGAKYKPFIIAEMSGNHNHSLDRALEIVDAAAACGVDALKIQTYTADTMTLDLREGEFFIDDPKSLWYGKSLYELYDEAHLPWEWHKQIFDRCKEHGILGFSTPFDSTSVDFLEELDVPFYKIASFENTDLRLIKKVASTKKPMIISTGMATISELDDTVKTLRSVGCENFILLKCTSNYPASPKDTNLMTIPHMRQLFDCQVGLSDHTLGIGVAVASVALSATVIEKHFTLARKDGGVDSEFSLEPFEMKMLVEETERAWLGLGKIHYSATEKEKKSLVFRRSIYVTSDLKVGDIITENNIRTIRPGYGLPTKYFEQVLGKKVTKDLKKGQPLEWGALSA